MIDTSALGANLSQVVQQILAFLPQLLGALVILVLGWLLSRLLASLTRKLGLRIGLDRMASRSGLSEGLAQAQITRPLSDLIALVVFWLVFLSAALLALDTLGLTMAVLPLQNLIGYLPRVLAAILVMIVGATLAQFMERTTQVAAAGMGVEFHRALGQAVRILILIATVIIAVGLLGVDVSLFTDALVNLLTIAAAGLALTFALGGREVVRNLLAGYYARETYAPGDRLELGGVEGVLEAIGTLNAEVLVGEDRVVLPNTDLIEKMVIIRKAAAQ